MKQTIKLNEAQLRKVVAESVKKVLKEETFQGANRLQFVHDKLQEVYNLIISIEDSSIPGTEENNELVSLMNKVSSAMLQCRKAGQVIGIQINY